MIAALTSLIIASSLFYLYLLLLTDFSPGFRSHFPTSSYALNF